MGQNLNCCIVMMGGKGGNSKKHERWNEIISNEEMYQLHGNGILLKFNVWHNVCTLGACCSKWPPALAMHKLANFKTACIAIHMVSWLFCSKQHHPWCAIDFISCL
jgi:hypothetical protein